MPNTAVALFLRIRLTDTAISLFSQHTYSYADRALALTTTTLSVCLTHARIASKRMNDHRHHHSKLDKAPLTGPQPGSAAPYRHKIGKT